MSWGPCGSVDEVEGPGQGDFRASNEGPGIFAASGVGLSEQARQRIGDQGNMDPTFDGIFAAAREAFDLEVPLDPLGRRLDPPALLVEFGDVSGRPGRIVGDEPRRLPALTLDDDLIPTCIDWNLSVPEPARPELVEGPSFLPTPPKRRTALRQAQGRPSWLQGES